MSTWASRLSSKKAAQGEGGGTPSCGTSPILSCAPSPDPSTGCGGGGAEGAAPPELREEFRAVAEAYNEQNVCLLRLPPDCWDAVTAYLPYTDVVALSHTCRVLWAVLHQRESVWWRQLGYFHHDVRDLRGGKLLFTAPLFPDPCSSASVSRFPSMLQLPSPTAKQEVVAGIAPGPAPRMSAHERFFQERRVYVLDTHREWHFQELADVEDKATGMFTVALHDGRADAAGAAPAPLSAAASSLTADSFSLSGGAWAAGSPLLPRPAPTVASPISNSGGAPQERWQASSASLTPTPTPPHRRTTSVQTNGTSAGNSPSLAPALAPPTPPLLPRIGEPIINDHNPLLRLRVFAIEPAAGGGERRADNSADHNRSQVSDARASGQEGRSHRGAAQPSSSLSASLSASLAGMTEEQVMEYVMRLSLAEAQQEQQQQQQAAATATAAAAAAGAAPASRTPPTAPSPVPDAATASAKVYHRQHRRGTTPAASLPLSALLAVLDALNNKALDQLQHYHVRNCTDHEDPDFLRRLAETLRSAKHRRLHLGNHHRAVRNNGQTTRNRAGRPVAATGSAEQSSLSVSGANAGGGTTTPPLQPQPQPQPPPPMNRMLRGFHGDLLEITEREAQLVAGTLLGMPRVIDEFVVFRCYDPALLYRKLHPPPATHTDSVARDKRRGAAPLKPLPFFTRFFLAPELCHDGFIALIVVDVVRALVIVEKEAVATDNPDWASPQIARGGRVVVHGQGYNAQLYTRDEYNYVPPNPIRRHRDPDSES